MTRLGPLWATILCLFSRKDISMTVHLYSKTSCVVVLLNMFFLPLKSSEDVHLLGVVSNAHHDIQFTFELEKCQQLPFLDVRVNKSATGLSTGLLRRKLFKCLFPGFSFLAPK